MSQTYVITEQTGVEALVMSVQEKVAQIAYQYVRPLAGFSHEDLFSVAMTKVMSAAVKALPKASFSRSANKSYQRKRAYLLRTARNEMISYYRDGYGDPLKRPAKTHPSPLVSLDDHLYDTLPSLVPVPNNRDFSLLYQTINALPVRYRKVVCMRFGLLGQGVHRPCEIATLLQISQSTVSYRLYRGLTLLRERTELLTLVGNNGAGNGIGTKTAVGQGDENDALARLIADFESTPSYIERFKDGRESWKEDTVTDQEYFSALSPSGLDLALQQAGEYLTRAESDLDDAYPTRDVIIDVMLIQQVQQEQGARQ